MRNVVVTEINKLAANDSRIMMMTADLGYGVLEEFKKQFPCRFFNVGISEQLMTSAAAGMALSGNIVFTYSIGNFTTLRCIEQIRNDICYHNANVKIIAVGGGFSYGQLGMSHHMTEDIAMMRTLPNMRVLVPADPEEALACAKYAVQTDGPCYIRLARRGEPVLYLKSSSFNITNIQSVVAGETVALLVCGPIMNNAIEAAKELKKNGVSVSVYSNPCVKPIDKEMIRTIAKKYSLIFTIEEHQVSGGLGGIVAEIVCEMAEPHSRLCRIGLQDEYTAVVGDYEYLCDYYGLSSVKIASAISNILMLRQSEHENCYNQSK